MSIYDNDLKVGDLTTSYRSGYFIVTRVERRFYKPREEGHAASMGHKVGDEYNALIYARQIADAKGKPRKSRQDPSCDSSFCSPINNKSIKKLREQEISEAKDKYKDLLTLIKTHTNQKNISPEKTPTNLHKVISREKNRMDR